MLTNHEQATPAGLTPAPTPKPASPPTKVDAVPDAPVSEAITPAPTMKPAAPVTPAPEDSPADTILLPPLGVPQSSSARPGGVEAVAQEDARPIVLGPDVRVRAASEPLNPTTPGAPGAAPASTPPLAPAEPTAVRTPILKRSVFEAGKPAARVGDEVITLHELKQAFAIRRRGMPAEQPLTAEQRYMLAKIVLNDLVDRSIILQEAKRELKTPKRVQEFMALADKVWLEEELPPMLRQYAVTNIYELKEKMKERNESLDEFRENFRQEFLSRGFMEQKIRPKLEVGLSEMRSYYASHLAKYQRPAQVRWREVVFETAKSKSRAEARSKADALLARLRRNEDFVALAKSESDGPNKSSGGLWETSPGSYGVASVNQALESLQIGEISPVIEGPTSFHIVRVEERRPAGPADFAEVQDSINNHLRGEKARLESHVFLEKLRHRTIVSTVFDDPDVVRASNERMISGPSAPPVRR